MFGQQVPAAGQRSLKVMANALMTGFQRISNGRAPLCGGVHMVGDRRVITFALSSIRGLTTKTLDHQEHRHHVGDSAYARICLSFSCRG